MKFNSIYNLCILLFLYAFCCVCVLGIEAIYSTELGMWVVYRNIWTAAGSTIILSPLIILWLCKLNTENIADEDIQKIKEENTRNTYVNISLTTGFLIVVLTNLSCTSKFILGELETTPFCLGILVNIFAIIAYFTNYFTLDRYYGNKKYKTILVFFVVIFSVSSVALAQLVLPVNKVRRVYQNALIHEMLKTLENNIKTTENWTPNPESWGERCEKTEKIKSAVEKGDITISMMDNTHVKLSWKRKISLSEINASVCHNSLLNCYNYIPKFLYDWGTFYKQDSKIVEMTAKIKKLEQTSKKN